MKLQESNTFNSLSVEDHSNKLTSFIQNFENPDTRIDNQLHKQRHELEQSNKEVLRLIVLAVEYLAKQALPFRGNSDYKVNFSDESINRGNFVALIQLIAKLSSSLENQTVRRRLLPRFDLIFCIVAHHAPLFKYEVDYQK